MPTPLDHAVVVLFAVIFPLLAWWRFPAIRRLLESGQPGVRRRIYVNAMAMQWGLTALALLAWWVQGRSAAELGLSTPTLWTAGGVVVALGLVVALALAQRAAAADEEGRRELQGVMNRAMPFLPQDERDLRVFHGLAVTAGTCEELLFRGYLMWYLAAWMNLPLVVVVSSLIFGAAHIYQGRLHVLQITGVGLVVALLYVGTGALWASIVLHVGIDLCAGRFALRVFSPAGAAEVSTGAEAPPPDSAPQRQPDSAQ